jgi:hypothetical protein
MHYSFMVRSCVDIDPIQAGLIFYRHNGRAAGGACTAPGRL